MTIGEGFGQPGTRVTKRLGLDDEVWAYILQALVGTAALDTVLTCVLLTCMLVSWWLLPLFLAVAGFGVGLVVLLFSYPPPRWVRFVFGNLWSISALAGVAVAIWWAPVLDAGLAAIVAQIGQLFSLPRWAYVALGVVLLVIALRKWQAAVGLLACVVLAGVLLLMDGAVWASAWRQLRWLLVPYGWPLIGFCLLLALAMAKEILYPNLEWTMKPISLEELREVGLIGLYAPGLHGREPPVVEGPVIEVNVPITDGRTRPQVQRPRLPGSPEAREFYRAVHRGESFSMRTAAKYGVGRGGFEGIRDALLDRSLAEWKNEQHPNLGVDLTPAGQRLIEQLALVGTPPPPGVSV